MARRLLGCQMKGGIFFSFFGESFAIDWLSFLATKRMDAFSLSLTLPYGFLRVNEFTLSLCVPCGSPAVSCYTSKTLSCT